MSTAELTSIETPAFLDVDVAGDGTIVGVAPSGVISRWGPDAEVWTALAGDWPSLAQATVGSSDDLWCLDSAGEVYHASLTGGPTHVPGKLACISAAADGTVLGVTAGGEAVRYLVEGGTWEPVAAPGRLRRISVGTAERVLALDTEGHLYLHDHTGGWHPLAGSFQDISAAYDGTVWAITADGHATIYGGDESNGWLELPVTLHRVAVGSRSNVWGLDDDSHVVNLAGGQEPFCEVRRALPGTIGVLWDAQDPFDETRSTHLWIVNQAARLAAADSDPAGHQVVNLIRPGERKIGDPFHDQLCQGLYDADWLDEYNGPWYYVSQSWAGHFYDPDTKQNWLKDDKNTARNNVTRFAGNAGGLCTTDEPDQRRRRLRPSAERGQAGYNLGLALHYLTDITQPMHAGNFTWQDSHPTLGYHSRVEEYAMTQQAKVTPPAYTPPTNGPMGLSCPRRPAINCNCNSACQDFGLYCHAAARNAKDKYFVTLRDVAGSNFWGWPGKSPPRYWEKNVVDPLLAPMLRDAILVTAQFLVGWMQWAKTLFSYFEYGPNWKNVRGYLTSVAAGADGTVWGVDALRPDSDNISRWTGTGWEAVKGHLTHIAVGSNSHIWGVNTELKFPADNVYRWNGSTFESVKGHLTHLAVGSDGTVWGVNALQLPDADNVYRWNGTTWEVTQGRLTHVAVGSKSHIWGVNARLPISPSSSNIARWNGTTWEPVKGYLSQIGAAPDGTVWGVNGQQLPGEENVYRWNGQTWDRIPGHLTQIAPTSASTFWGINGERRRYDFDNTIYQYVAAQ